MRKREQKFSVKKFLTHFLHQVGECQGRAWDDEEVAKSLLIHFHTLDFIHVSLFLAYPTKSAYLQIYLDMTALRHRKGDERSNVQRTRRQVKMSKMENSRRKNSHFLE